MHDALAEAIATDTAARCLADVTATLLRQGAAFGAKKRRLFQDVHPRIDQNEPLWARRPVR
jgi:hypothetical protein